MPHRSSHRGRPDSALLVIASFLVAIAPGRALAVGPTTWTVRPGDVLGTIAQRFGVSVEDLERWNGLDDDAIEVGQQLRVQNAHGGGAHDGDGADADADAPPALDYRIAAGDTLGAIAHRFHTTVDALLTLNPDLSPDRIRAGDRIDVGRGRRVDYEVGGGDTLASIAEDYGVSIHDIVRWNPSLDPDHIGAGSHLTIYSSRPPSLSESVGLAYHGRLLHAVRLPQRPGYVLRDRSRAFGTRETIDHIEQAFAHLRQEDRRAPRVEIHDLSDRDGGRLAGHHSHQSGRDVDIAYFQTSCPDHLCRFRRLDPSDLDVARTWELVEPWLRAGQVEMIFMDYALQKPLYDYARHHGATTDELRHWFQYPSPKGMPVGIIRNFPHHRDHMHVRFVCPPTDHRCLGLPIGHAAVDDGN